MPRGVPTAQRLAILSRRCRTSTTSSAPTAAIGRWAPTATPASAARPAAARSAASPTCSSCSTTTTRRPTRRSSPATRTARIVDCGRGSFELTGLKTEQAIGRPVHEVLGLRFDDGTDHVGTALEWEVRVQGKAVEVHAEHDLPATRRRRHLPRLRRRGGRRAGRSDAHQPSLAPNGASRRRPLASSSR